MHLGWTQLTLNEKVLYLSKLGYLQGLNNLFSLNSPGAYYFHYASPMLENFVVFVGQNLEGPLNFQGN